jgi:hypothetical protein
MGEFNLKSMSAEVFISLQLSYLSYGIIRA